LVPCYKANACKAASFDRDGVSEIGLICLVITVTGFVFGSGVTLAYFHDRGRDFSANELFRITCTDWVREKLGIIFKEPVSARRLDQRLFEGLALLMRSKPKTHQALELPNHYQQEEDCQVIDIPASVLEGQCL
jgi:hypothetical protein